VSASGAEELLAGRLAIVTGGASGIGAGVARQLAAAGAAGCVFDLPAAGQDAGTPQRWTRIDVDVRDESAVADAFARAAGDLGGLDVVVAAAGIVPRWSGVESLDLDEWDDVFRVNVRGVAATIKHAARHIADGGSIVAIASLNAWRGDGNLTSYAASKHAVLGIVRSAALDLGARGIRVNAVAPGPIATEALLARIRRRESEGGLAVADALERAAGQTALGRIATVDDVASATLFLASELAAGVTGQLLPVDGGIA
jgi:NAD(P)-dependent dehydrogenase (short-subunit alcohol dehydrogenase family)